MRVHSRFTSTLNIYWSWGTALTLFVHSHICLVLVTYKLYNCTNFRISNIKPWWNRRSLIGGSAFINCKLHPRGVRQAHQWFRCVPIYCIISSRVHMGATYCTIDRSWHRFNKTRQLGNGSIYWMVVNFNDLAWFLKCRTTSRSMSRNFKKLRTWSPRIACWWERHC